MTNYAEGVVIIRWLVLYIRQATFYRVALAWNHCDIHPFVTTVATHYKANIKSSVTEDIFQYEFPGISKTVAWPWTNIKVLLNSRPYIPKLK